jgi:uncharacterized membrane protein YdjX (TVP38/TMEM64 family)
MFPFHVWSPDRLGGLLTVRLSVFICFLLVSVIVTIIGSYFAGASIGAIALRVTLVLVVLQTAYFLLMLVVGPLISTAAKPSDQMGKDERADPLAETQKQ